jgi:hypothetical protein
MVQPQLIHLTYVTQSEQRSSSSRTNYAITLPAIPSGAYKITFRLLLPYGVYAGPCDLQVRNSGISALASGIPGGYHHVMTCSKEAQCTGVLFANNPGLKLAVRFTKLGSLDDTATGLDVGEHSIYCEFERL